MPKKKVRGSGSRNGGVSVFDYTAEGLGKKAVHYEVSLFASAPLIWFDLTIYIVYNIIVVFLFDLYYI